jgi:hypothetical protein
VNGDSGATNPLRERMHGGGWGSIYRCEHELARGGGWREWITPVRGERVKLNPLFTQSRHSFKFERRAQSVLSTCEHL